MTNNTNNPLDFFKEISCIPRGSGNTEKIRTYLEDFARHNNLSFFTDAAGNVLIKKAGSYGKENEPPVIIQGHMDMVAVKDDNIKKDLSTDPLDINTHGGVIRAIGTSLGADDGVAVAYMLSLLSKNDLKHPPLECLFTTDEEIGLIGASNADLSNLTGKRLINIDSEEEGQLVCGCAGGIRTDTHFDINRQFCEGQLYRVSISGLSGGHSGIMIHEGRANAIVLMARIAASLLKEEGFLLTINGGGRDNVIATDAHAEFLFEKDRTTELTKKVQELEKTLKAEFSITDPDMKIESKKLEWKKCEIISKNDTEKILTFIRMSPNGVLNMSSNMPGLVETSANIGIVETTEAFVTVTHTLRSSSKSRKDDLLEKTRDFGEVLGARCSFRGDYPPWEYKEDSPLRDKMTSVYKNMYGTPMRVEAIHAGLECGYFFSKIKDLDCVSIGPDLKDVHSTRESVTISSLNNVWEYLVKVLEEI